MINARVVLLFYVLWASLAQAAGIGTAVDVRPSVNSRQDVPDWVDEAVTGFPSVPREVDLIEFYVSAATANRFFVDGATLAVGPDDVVRYTLIIRTAGGASNVTYEGIRCGTGSYRLYATARQDGSWAWSRSGDWRPIENKSVNRHHAALSREFFCPLASRIRTAEEGRNALHLGHSQLLPW